LDLPDEVVRTKKCVDERCRATVVGPGVGTSVKALAWMLDQVRVGTPTVLDADALRPEMLARAPRNFTWVVTPHEGEFGRLFQPCGSGVSRVATAKWAARQHGLVVLLKGPLTVITDGERVHLVDAGSPTLATAGSGDVLSGVIGALLARGHGAMTAASLGALVHAEASQLLYEGEPASALAPALCEVLGEWHRAS
jgi:NAD(P)H-hydrate epimerase